VVCLHFGYERVQTMDWCGRARGGRDQEWTPDGGIASLKEPVRGTAEDAKEGGNDGFAP
jgi:hypothetical protein